MTTPRLPMFVFGTLRSGQCNHHLIHGRYEKRLQARLYGYVRVAPLMIDVSRTDCVLGELFFFQDDVYEQALLEIDDLESLPPGKLIGRWYERKVVIVSTPEGEHEAWAYVKSKT